MRDCCLIWHFGLVTIIIIHVEQRLKSQSFFKGSEFSRSEFLTHLGVLTSHRLLRGFPRTDPVKINFKRWFTLKSLKFNRFLPSPSSLPSAVLDCLWAGFHTRPKNSQLLHFGHWFNPHEKFKGKNVIMLFVILLWRSCWSQAWPWDPVGRRPGWFVAAGASFFPFAQSEKKTKKKTEELTQIVRESVRNEIAFQRSVSNSSLFIQNSRP